MGILAIIMLGLAATAGISVRGGVSSRQRNRATYLASQMLETLIAGNLDNGAVLAFNGDDTSVTETYPIGGLTDLWGRDIRAQLGDDASGSISVVEMEPAGRLRITVTVRWRLRNQEYRVETVGVR